MSSSFRSTKRSLAAVHATLIAALAVVSLIPLLTAKRSASSVGCSVVISARLPGADAEETERRVLSPLEHSIGQLQNLVSMVGSADADRATIRADFRCDDDAAALERLHVVRGVTLAAKETLPSGASVPVVTRAEVNHDGGDSAWTMDLALLIAGVVLATGLLAMQFRSAFAISGVSFAADLIADRYHDALATGFARRWIPLVGAVLLLCTGAMAAASSTDDLQRAPTSAQGFPTPISAVADIEIAIRGDDNRMLSGLAQRIADEVGRLPGVADARREPQRGRIEHVDGTRRARVHVTLRDDARKATADRVEAVIRSIALPPAHDIRIVGAIAELRWAQRVHGLSLFMLVLIAGGALAWYFREPVTPLVTLLLVPCVAAGSAISFPFVAVESSRWLSVAIAVSLTSATWQSARLFAVAQRKLRHDGAIRVAVVDAARARLIPIVVATVTQSLCLMPLAIAGSERVSPAAIAGLCGGVVGMASLLLVLPIAYAGAWHSVSSWRTTRLVHRVRRAHDTHAS